MERYVTARIQSTVNHGETVESLMSHLVDLLPTLVERGVSCLDIRARDVGPLLFQLLFAMPSRN